MGHHMPKKNVVMGRRATAIFRRMPYVRMGVPKVFKRVKFIDQFTPLRDKHDVHWKLPILAQGARQCVALVRHLRRVIHDDPSGNEFSVDQLDYLRIGEQTCSQVCPARSTILLVKASPYHDGHNGFLQFLGHGQRLVRRNPLNVEEREENMFKPIVSSTQLQRLVPR